MAENVLKKKTSPCLLNCPLKKDTSLQRNITPAIFRSCHRKARQSCPIIYSFIYFLFIHSCIQAFIRSFVRSFVRIVHSFICLFIYLLFIYLSSTGGLTLVEQHMFSAAMIINIQEIQI